MKGTVVVCLRELVTERAGEAVWARCVAGAGLDPFAIITPGSDVDDGDARRLLGAVCATLGLTLAEAADAFGEHWVRHYSPRLYHNLYRRHASAREFLLDLNRMHASLTKAIPGARPPRFRFEWPDERTLVMHYESHRDLIELAAGMVRAVGRLYQEELSVKHVSRHRLQVVFVALGRPASPRPEPARSGLPPGALRPHAERASPPPASLRPDSDRSNLPPASPRTGPEWSSPPAGALRPAPGRLRHPTASGRPASEPPASLPDAAPAAPSARGRGA